jgi:four helix bundle protein
MPKGSTIRSYKDLDVWTMSMSLAESCYRVTRHFPREEMYGMTAQIRRASTSIPANIAEGYGRDRTGSFIQFLRISRAPHENSKHMSSWLAVSACYGAMPCHVCWTNARRSARCFAQ